jgi:beta-galactosidase
MAHSAFQQPSQLWYGGDYNPEQWPEAIWQEDVRLMQEAGVNLVSVGIFSWALLEPKPGEYDFGWFDRLMDLLHAHGIRACLATATASPPPWLAQRYPESLPVTADGVTLWPGGRQQYCPHSDAYREHSTALVRRIAERYGQHPALAMWHINNEYGCHVAECFCDHSAAAFRTWLEARYGTVDALNEAWGTAFWSQHYGDWSEINPPRRAPTFANPTQQLDWKRFSSDSLLECCERERAILREYAPDVPATTNFMGFFKPLDYWKWARSQDVISHDSYPDPSNPAEVADAAMSYDLMRSLGGGQPWVLMEQTTSQVNWRRQNVLKRPGQMRLWSYQALARGANGIMFFQWRAARAGAEKFHGAMVPHVGTEQSRVWREVVQLGNELKQLGDVLPARVPAKVAILFDWESWWALELDSKPSADVRLMEQIRSYYAPLYARNIAVDFAGPNSDLSAYSAVLVPNLYMVRDATAQALEQYVSGGGTLAMSFFSGIADENEHIRLGGYPAPFRRMLGLRVEEFDPYIPGQQNGVQTGDGSTFTCDLWSDVIDLEGAQALASFTGDFYAGRPAVTQHAFGAGHAFYSGTRLSAAGMEWLLDRVLGAAGIATRLGVPATVELIERAAGAQRFLFALNHSAAPATLPLAGTFTDALSGQDVAGEVALGPYGVAVLRGGE